MTTPANSTQAHPDTRAQAAAEDEAQQLTRKVSQILSDTFARDESLIYRLATAVIKGLRDSGHRGVVYIPAGGKAARNAAIKAEFNGTNLREVCKRHNVAPRTVYRIVNRK